MENNCCGEKCCKHKDEVKCEHGMTHCCKNWRKCHIMRKLICLVIILLAFWMGTQWCEKRGERRYDNRFERGSMMKWNYNESNVIPKQKAVDTITVEVTNPATETTPKQ